MEWLWTPGVDRQEYDDDPRRHGSCVASKAAGTINGVSKYSRLVVVKASLDLADTELAFRLAYDDIVSKRRQKKSVVLFPRSSLESYSPGVTLPEKWDSIMDIMQLLFEQGVEIVVPADNHGTSRFALDTVPAIWASGMPLIVVGATTIYGDYADFTQGRDFISTVWAPGVDIQCAGAISNVAGTSVAAGLVTRSPSC